LLDASLVEVAIAVENALGPASDVGIAKVSGNTSASRGSFARFAFGVGSARRRIARFVFHGFGLRRQVVTLSERISGQIDGTRANGVVIHGGTFGADAAGPDARILALLLDAGPVGRTFGIEHAFGSAARWSADKVGQTRASFVTVDDLAHGIRSARRRLARNGRAFSRHNFVW